MFTQKEGREGFDLNAISMGFKFSNDKFLFDQIFYSSAYKDRIHKYLDIFSTPCVNKCIIKGWFIFF